MRKTTKQYHKVAKETYVGGNYTIKTGGNYTIWAESIEYNAGGQIIMSGKEGGVVYGDYVPREEIYTSHPKVEKVEFFDEKGNLLNQNTKNFYYGQKLKIKVTTKDTKDGEIITLRLKGKTKSKNQKFDVMDECRWIFVPIKDNSFETDYFTLNPNWYSDDFEKYNYDTHETEIKETDLNEYFAEVNLDAKSVFLPLAGQRLKPITYKRNYEELIGLFKTDNSGDKDLLENYENLYIDKYADENEDIKDIVDEFSKWMCEDTIRKTSPSIEEIENQVSKSAEKLWENAVWQHKDHINTVTTTNKETGEKKEEKQERKAILDDRPLYWARIAMQVILKRQYIFIKDILTLPKDQQDLFFKNSIVPKTSKLAKVVQLFEEKSRNYDGISFNSSEATGCKKVLITGFDPFILNQFDNTYLKSVTNPNIKQSNPSGIVALALANNDKLGAYIQTMVVPVRYTDFDGNQSNNSGQGEGIIEKYIKEKIKEVDMIVTVSQAGPNNYHIDVFATATREGFNDNMDFKREDESKSFSGTTPETIKTTLPIQMTQGKSKAIYWGKYNQKNETSKNATLDNYPKEKVYNGPGGNYLSNEIFYRVAKLRMERPTLKTGHFHIAKIQEKNEDLDSSKAHELLETVKQTLTEGFKTL